MSGRAMSKIMQPWLIAGSVMTQHVGTHPQPAESVLGRSTREAITRGSDEERCNRTCLVCLTASEVLSQHSA